MSVEVEDTRTLTVNWSITLYVLVVVSRTRVYIGLTVLKACGAGRKSIHKRAFEGPTLGSTRCNVLELKNSVVGTPMTCAVARTNAVKITLAAMLMKQLRMCPIHCWITVEIIANG
jgi:hypothetical protein